MPDPRDYPDVLPPRPGEEEESTGWIPIAISGGVIAVITVLALALPENRENVVRADRSGVSTDIDTTGRSDRGSPQNLRD
jgi:hypothetical protein